MQVCFLLSRQQQWLPRLVDPRVYVLPQGFSMGFPTEAISDTPCSAVSNFFTWGHTVPRRVALQGIGEVTGCSQAPHKAALMAWLPGPGWPRQGLWPGPGQGIRPSGAVLLGLL